MRRRAAELGAQIQAEDGPGRIAELFTQHVCPYHGPGHAPNLTASRRPGEPHTSAELAGHAESPDLEPVATELQLADSRTDGGDVRLDHIHGEHSE